MTVMTTNQHLFIENLAAHQPFPDDGILTRTVFDDDALKVVLFTFSPGQALSEHTASLPAVMHFLDGEATVTLGESVQDVAAGAWVHMPPNLPHGINAKTPVRMVLYLVKVRTDRMGRPQEN